MILKDGLVAYVKKWILKSVSLFCVFLCLTFLPIAVFGETSSVSVSAHAAILIEAESGRVLYEKNADERRSMASTTKIMTALLAVESEQRNEVIEITRDMVQVEGSSMYLKEGDKVTLETLAYGLLLESGNDAANAIAITLGGSMEGFVELMNQRARALGLSNTHFATPSGLDAEDHYTTASDLAKLAAVAMKEPRFQEICSKSSATVEFVEPATKRTLYNHNRLLKEMEGCIGVKTGFTKKSGRCLVTCCEREGVRLIAVTLNAPNDWQDHKALMEYGFSMAQRTTIQADGLELYVPVVGGTEAFVKVEPVSQEEVTILQGEENEISMRIELPHFVYAPVKEGQVVGRVVYSVNGRLLCDLSLVTSESRDFLVHEPGFFEKIKNWFLSLFR